MKQFGLLQVFKFYKFSIYTFTLYSIVMKMIAGLFKSIARITHALCNLQNLWLGAKTSNAH